jgi:hypothetical protein
MFVLYYQKAPRLVKLAIRSPKHSSTIMNSFKGHRLEKSIILVCVCLYLILSDTHCDLMLLNRFSETQKYLLALPAL